ncbi:TRAP transporter solute receptor, TAXI family [Alteribacillus persepolensis]|uniref:TRAP transporter solute receptor, TAXI family n=1 Tax=Alteribacillus persepolensis TaxID=568899 RepID=A0A1G8A7A5_9BACI|nr:TAXI family TRAP transporter solute-binding subunit [Alteribacillus persepolensis]SDH16751.1 TRAP transporter solute receptor, TAXI family [Alteribacillus persepolensis]
MTSFWYKMILFTGLIFLLAACSEQQSADSKTSQEGVVPIYTPSASGINYVISAGTANVLTNKKEFDGRIVFSTEATSGSTELMYLLLESEKNHEPAIAAPANVAATELYNGNSEELPGEHTGLRNIGFLSGTTMHVVSAVNSSIEDFNDLQGKTIGIPAPETPPSNFLEHLLDAYGLAGEYETLPLGSLPEVQEALAEGSVDAGLLFGAVPAPTVQELTQTEDVNILSIDHDVAESFFEEHPYYSPVTLEAGTYAGQERELFIGSFYSNFITHQHTDDDIVYHFIEGIMENQDTLQAVHPTFNIDENTIIHDNDLPYHDGAIRYFEDNDIDYNQ